MCKFALGHVSDDSHHLVTMEGSAWMVSTVSRVIAPTRATKAGCVRTTLMTAEFPRAPTALSATMVLRTTVAVATKVIQVCNRYLRSTTPFTNYRLFLLWFPCAPQLSQHVLAGAGFLCSKADGLKEAVKQHSVHGTWLWCVHILLLLCSFSSLILSLPFPHLHHISCFNYQLNAQFLYSITIYMLHYNPRHFSSSTMLVLRGQIVLLHHLVSSISVNGRTVCRLRALNRCMVWPFTDSDDTWCCNNTIWPPEDEHCTAWNMLRIIM